MPITVTDYLDVISSWCFWSEPTWAELKRRYEGRVQFHWKIALMDPRGLPTSREQEQWFYRRSGMMMRSPFMLNTDWYDPSLPEWLAPNCVAEAARDFGFVDDRVRLALSHAALREGCTTCHNPHGSINRKLLVESDPNLCLKCHAQVQNQPTGQIYIGNVSHTLFLQRGTCWSAGCHTAVHGSNVHPRMLY